MIRYPFPVTLTALLFIGSFAVDSGMAQDKEKSQATNHVQQAEEISALSGRPILAIAGSNT